MDLAALADKYRNFYVPAFSVKVSGGDLMREHLVPVSQVEVDLVLGGSARFSFTVVNAYSFKDHRFTSGDGRPVLDLLAFGATVEIRMGYGDAKGVPVIMRGVITEVSTNFPDAGGPELSISGYDNAFPLTNGKNSRTWSKALDSSAVQEIASFHNLQASIDNTKQLQAQIEQNQESDFEFVKKLADRNHYELYVDDSGKKSVLRFGTPNDRAGSVVTLAWGAGLLSFKPTANLAGQVSGVLVYGWDSKHQKQFIGRAGSAELSGKEGRQRSPGDLIGAVVRDSTKQPILRLRQPVFTQAEADTRAKAALNENGKQFLTGDAETIGLPEILPDRNIELTGLGAPFSRTYYIQQATHKVDSNGYRTRFKTKETAL
jgi:phage protein D